MAHDVADVHAQGDGDVLEVVAELGQEKLSHGNLPDLFEWLLTRPPR